MRNWSGMSQRVAVGKALGFVVGLIAWAVVRTLDESSSVPLGLGLCLWYTAFGAVIALIGLYHVHPVGRFRLHWALRGAMAGTALNLPAVVLAWEPVGDFLLHAFGPDGWFASPWWMLLDGTVAGMLIDGLLTRWFGEGPRLCTSGEFDKMRSTA